MSASSHYKSEVEAARAAQAAASGDAERAAALLRRGRAHWVRCEYQEASRSFEQASMLATSVGDPHLRAASLRDLGAIRRSEGR